MRLAFFSPMPPSKSGIADYSAALLEPLARHVRIGLFDQESVAFDPAQFDLALYQLGNNPYHEFVYEMALRHPGVVVMHEANLHHLVAGLTIRRDDWEAYLREAEYDGGEAALAYAQPRPRPGGRAGLRRPSHDPPRPRVRPRHHRP